ncbi:hypothetical protein CDD81_2524 [Ophiocordyceps australis]|uniref:Chromo domain-containing protein n=1 Tax=Ophiocordyceps australis TaxID=1399860 RepID=A0A2C5YD66_9HYPO|nr:hypothetical protein CDD81_2524 [Ophiocordyceps australis]
MRILMVVSFCTQRLLIKEFKVALVDLILPNCRVYGMESLSDLEPVSSTTEESDDPEKTYAVEMILAERKLAGDHRYLVKWEGEQYPLGFSTWEPRSNLGSATISAWERFKKQSGRRTRENFSIHDYWAAAEARFKKKRDLHKDRNRRRELLGQQPKPYNTCFEDELENLRRNLEDFEDSKSVANDVIDVEMLDVDDDKTEPSAPSLTLSQAERSTASRNNKTHTTRRTGMFTNPESFSTHAGSYFTGSSSLNSPNPSVGLDTHHHPHRPMHSLIPRVASVPASERSPERARKTAINSRKSTEQFKNVFIDGRKRKQGTSLSSAMSDQSKASKWLSFRKQNIGNKQLRDGEGLRAPSALPTSWMKLGSETSEFVRRDPNCRGKQQGRDELVTQEAGTLFAAEITSNLTAQDDASNDQSISADVTTSSLPSLLVVGGQRKMKKRSVHWGDISEIPPNSYSDSEPGELFVSQEASSHLPLSKPCQLEGTESQSTILTFIGLTDGGKPPWLQQIWRKDRLVFTHTCTALDWISAILQFTQSKIHQGQVAADSNFRNISLVANRLKAAGQGVVCFDKDFCILVAPTRCEEWSKAFLKEVNDATGYLLAYIVFQPLENFGSMVAPIFCPDLEAPRENPRDQPLSDLERVLGINYDGLLSPRGRDAQQQNFFLMFPHSAEQEAMLVRQLLLRDKANCRIWTILVSGNWKAFTKCDHGTTIVHEDFVWMLHTLPGLSDLLADSERVNQNFWLWKRPFISPTQPLDAKSAPLSGIELRPIFPQGHAWLMTPSFLISQPEEAYRFFKSISSPTVKRRKLVLCSDIEEMLLDLAMRTNSPSSSRTASSEAIQARAKLWCNIVFLIRDSASAIDDWDELSSSPLILAPEMLDGNDEQSLVNWIQPQSPNQRPYIQNHYSTKISSGT